MSEVLKRQFMPESHTYCGHTGPWLERAFRAEANRLGIEFQRCYLVGYWTDYLVQGGIPRRKSALNRRRLKQFIMALPKDEPLFTVIQHCEGFFCDWPKHLTLFGAGGTGDVPLPLLIPKLGYYRGTQEPEHFCSFMGRFWGPNDRSGLRKRMLDTFHNVPGFVQAPLMEYARYCELMRASKFVLCPRGYGPTSFRLYEALALGAIPVYIHDGNPWLPYREELDWDKLSILVHEKELPGLPERLRELPQSQLTEMHDYIRAVHDHYFTITGVVMYVHRRLGQHGEG